MPTFICEECGCIDNTAMRNNYWSCRMKRNSFKDDYANNHLLCTECTPTQYKDGSSTGSGKWHGVFSKEHWRKYGMEKILEAEARKQGDMVNATKYFMDNGLIQK